TGATTARDGRFEAANGGTLFLDEVGELPSAAQVKLLRFLEDQRFMRVGGSEEVAVTVRVVAATNRDLGSMVAAGSFREDLAYRLRVVTIALPPLVDRLDDLPALVRHILGRVARRLSRSLALTDEAMAVLSRHGWPGNVRELKHVLEEAAVLATGGIISAEHLAIAGDANAAGQPSGLRSAVQSAAARLIAHAPGAVWRTLLDEIEDPMIRAALAHTEGNQLKAAELLGINRITLKKRMDELGISNDGGRGPGGGGR
ncbi:MAG: sigma-54-dependent Fis family transcriptional regulator, partial [Planctomycetes bacterium]|nr:sigma-54-dependent Fis family transcriptional regulator [Planctomycetota bacterium]